MKNKKGLTLIELLAVIAIIAILFVLLIPLISNAIEKSKETSIMVDFRDYERAIKSHMMGDGAVHKNLDKNLRFDSPTWYKSYKKNAFGENYIQRVYKDEHVMEITTTNGKGKEYSLVVTKLEGEIQAQTYGFTNNITATKELKGETNEYEYVLFGYNSIIITKYKGEAEVINIPNKIEEYDVKAIGREAFSKKAEIGNNKGKILKEVTIPGSVEYIGMHAFQANEIETLNLNEGLKIITQDAFYGNKIKSLNIPNSVEQIHHWAFYANKITTLTLGNNLKEIRAEAFKYNQIETVTIPSGVKIIGDMAFGNNPTMTTYRILGTPAIGSGVFPTTATRQ